MKLFLLAKCGKMYEEVRKFILKWQNLQMRSEKIRKQKKHAILRVQNLEKNFLDLGIVQLNKILSSIYYK